MNADITAVPMTATLPTLNMNTERRVALELLYLRTYPHLRDAAYGDPDIHFADADNIASAVASDLDLYSGPDDDVEHFTTWALATVVIPQVERLRWFYETRREHRDTVHGAIAGVLQGCADLGAELGYEKGLSVLDELEGQTWFLVYLALDSWLSEGTASLKTRLSKFARFQTLAWKSAQLDAKHRYGGEPVKAEARVFREADARSVGKLPERPVRLGPDDDPDEPRSRRRKKKSAPIKPRPVPLAPDKRSCTKCGAVLRSWSESQFCYPCVESNGLPSLRDARREARKRKKAAENENGV